MREIVIIRVFTHHVTFLIPCAPVEVAPFDRFSCFVTQRRVTATFTSSGEKKIFPQFFAKKREIPYSGDVKLHAAITPVL